MNTLTALAGHFSDYGIKEEFISTVRDKVTPGTSAHFPISDNAVGVRVIEAMTEWPTFEIGSTTLSKEEESRFREALVDEQAYVRTLGDTGRVNGRTPFGAIHLAYCLESIMRQTPT